MNERRKTLKKIGLNLKNLHEGGLQALLWVVNKAAARSRVVMVVLFFTCVGFCRARLYSRQYTYRGCILQNGMEWCEWPNYCVCVPVDSKKCVCAC